MKFILFVEGHTERRAIPQFLKRWLDDRLPQPVGIKPVRFEGWAELVKDSPTKAKLHLANSNVIAVIALLDLYGPTIYLDSEDTAERKFLGLKQRLENKVGQNKFFQFFAVHEVEAWLLSDPSIFPNLVKSSVQQFSNSPEQVNSSDPPAKLLDSIYFKQTGRNYKKVVHGRSLFSKLNPDIAYEKCPRLKELLDFMLKLAKDAAS